MTRFEQFIEGGVAAEERVDSKVVMRVVAMIAGRLEDRVEIERGDAQLLKVIESLDNAEQIAPFIAMGCRIALPRLKVRRLLDPIAGREPIGEDLVEDRVLHPVRCDDLGHRHAASVTRAPPRASAVGAGTPTAHERAGEKNI